MPIRMTDDEIQTLTTVIRTASNCPHAVVFNKQKSKYDGMIVVARIPDQHSADRLQCAELKFEPFIPDVDNQQGVSAAARMLMFMGLEDYPRRVATFYDYVAMAYEFGKQHRWT